MSKKKRKKRKGDVWDKMDPKELSRGEARTIGGHIVDSFVPNVSEPIDNKVRAGLRFCLDGK